MPVTVSIRIARYSRTLVRRQHRRTAGKVTPLPLSKSLFNYQFGAVAAFAALHLAALGVFFVPFRWSYFWLMLAMYAVRMFGMTAGYHRYFSHRSFQARIAAGSF